MCSLDESHRLAEVLYSLTRCMTPSSSKDSGLELTDGAAQQPQSKFGHHSGTERKTSALTCAPRATSSAWRTGRERNLRGSACGAIVHYSVTQIRTIERRLC